MKTKWRSCKYFLVILMACALAWPVPAGAESSPERCQSFFGLPIPLSSAKDAPANAIVEAYLRLIAHHESSAVGAADLRAIDSASDPFVLAPDGPSQRTHVRAALKTLETLIDARPDGKDLRAQLLAQVRLIIGGQEKGERTREEARDERGIDRLTIVPPHRRLRKAAREKGSAARDVFSSAETGRTYIVLETDRGGKAQPVLVFNQAGNRVKPAAPISVNESFYQRAMGGGRVAILHDALNVKLWDLNNESFLGEFKIEERINSLALSNDGRLLALTIEQMSRKAGERNTWILDLEGWNGKDLPRVIHEFNSDAGNEAIAFISGRRALAIAGFKGDVEVRTFGGRLTRTHKGKVPRDLWARFSPDGTRFVRIIRDTIEVRDTFSGELVYRGNLFSMAGGVPDPDHFLFTSDNRFLVISNRYRVMRPTVGAQGGMDLASSSGTPKIRIIDLVKNENVAYFDTPTSEVLGFSGDEKTLITMDWDGNVWQWDVGEILAKQREP